MTQDASLEFKSLGTLSTKFSKVPAIRKFESLLSDEEFETAGFKVARHPFKETCFIVPASQYIFADDDSSSNKLLGDEHTLLHSFNLLVAEEHSATESLARDLKPTVERLDELRAIAADEDLPFSEKSAAEVLRWLRTASPPALPSLFLLNNGNLRLVWKSAGTQLGVQFIGNGTAQFVYLGEDDQIDRIFGSLRVTELMKRISGLDLLELIGF